MSVQLDILRTSMQACGQRMGKLRQSLDKTRALFPLTTERVATLTDEQEESIDALILRYSQCASLIQDQIFRGIRLRAAVIQAQRHSHGGQCDLGASLLWQGIFAGTSEPVDTSAPLGA